MAGASGTIYHVYDNLELTFGELKEILALASEGRLEETVEKVDGLNIVFTWNPWESRVKFARGKQEIMNGGLSRAGLDAKFAGRGGILDAFSNAYEILSGAIRSITPELRQKIFGNAEVWYSAEIVYPTATNVINYDSNCIVFHGSPIFTFRDGQLNRILSISNFDYLRGCIEQMQAAVAQRNWYLHAPTFIALQRISDNSILATALAQIDSCMTSARMDDCNTLKEYVVKCLMENELSDFEADHEIRLNLAYRMLDIVGSMTITQLKKEILPNQQGALKYVYDNREEIAGQYLAPIEMAVHQFAIELLRGLKSILVKDHDKENERIKSELINTVKSIKSYRDKKEMTVLQKVLPQIGDLGKLSTCIEGIVFQYKGNHYKFTGAFAPINRLLGLVKYGRKPA